MTCLAITSFDALPGLFCNYHTLSNDFAGICQGLPKGKLVQHRQGYSSSGDQLLSSSHPPLSLRRLVEPAMECINGYILFYTFSNHLEAYGGKFNGNFPRLSMVCHNMRNHGQRLCIVLQRLFRPHANLPHDCLLACLTYTWSRANKTPR